MKYKLIEKANPLNRNEPKKWYASPVNAGKITLRDFARKIAGRSSLTHGDVESVLRNFLEELPLFLKMGMSVQLGDFCTMRLSISSEGSDLPGDFNARNIKKKRIIFTPGIELKEALESITFEQVKK